MFQVLDRAFEAAAAIPGMFQKYSTLRIELLVAMPQQPAGPCTSACLCPVVLDTYASCVCPVSAHVNSLHVTPRAQQLPAIRDDRAVHHVCSSAVTIELWQGVLRGRQ